MIHSTRFQRVHMQHQAVIDHIISWISRYVEASGLPGPLVVGVSGGIDSAVTSALCAHTGRQVIALSMPIYQDPDLHSLSQRQLAWLAENFKNVRTHTLDLTPLFQSCERVFPENIQDALNMANARSRLRMVTLHAFAGHNKGLVVGTGNKVEDFGVGFFTKYGDGGVDISPIADLMKSEVYALAEQLGILDDIRAAAPTDGLWDDGRTDESQLGVSYDELEWAMRYLEENTSDDSSSLSESQQTVLNRYQELNRINRHKVEPIPVCLIPDTLR